MSAMTSSEVPQSFDARRDDVNLCVNDIAASVDLSIILVNWNGVDLLPRALRCVYETVQDVSFEVIVVDNHSTDGSQAAIQDSFPKVRLIVNNINVGFGRANNQGVRAAQGNYFLLLNTDAFVHDGAIARMMAFMAEKPDAGVCGPRLFYEDGSPQPSCMSFPSLGSEVAHAFWLNKLSRRETHEAMAWRAQRPTEVEAVMGACMLVRREAVNAVGLFDEDFFMYSEEVDLCYRMRQGGWKVWFVPDAHVTHVWGGSARKVDSAFLARFHKSRVIFLRKHGGRMQARLYKASLWVSSLIRIVAGALVHAVNQNADVLRRTQNYRRFLTHIHRL